MDSSPGGARTISAASGGRVLAYNNISTIPQVVLTANPSRFKATFHNPGTVTIYLAPSFVENTGSDVALVPSVGALGGCITLPAGATVALGDEIQKPWQAFAASGTTNPLTVIPSVVQS